MFIDTNVFSSIFCRIKVVKPNRHRYVTLLFVLHISEQVKKGRDKKSKLKIEGFILINFLFNQLF